jgi:predicted GIY-YIG superfamily endonuclease
LPAAATERFTSASPITCEYDSNSIEPGSEFVKRYNVCRLVYVEAFVSPLEAIAHEKAVKNWRRDWKIRLVETDNLDWSDLSHLL